MRSSKAKFVRISYDFREFVVRSGVFVAILNMGFSASWRRRQTLNLFMLQETNEVKDEFSFSCNERVILAISALKLGYQSFMSDLRTARTIGHIPSKEYKHHSRWYYSQIKSFNNRIGELRRITEGEVLPLEKQVRQIIVTGIYLSASGSEQSK